MKSARICTSSSKRADIKNISVICGVFLLVFSVVMTVNRECVWGSETDWLSQHFVLPEYFRSRFYKTGELFPEFAPQIGAGQNIYNFSYYGLFNPLYIPAYLLPDISMALYIQVISIVSVIVSSVMCYYLMKRHYSRNTALFLSVIFMCASPIIFHSHRHVMFVSYFPFLFSAMLAVGIEDSIRSRALLVFSSYAVMMSSFYFSISAFLVILIYCAFVKLKEYGNLSLKQLVSYLSVQIKCLIIGVLCSAVLCVPTFFTLLRGREEGSSFINIMKFLIPAVNLEYLLYSPYSVGMTAISVVSAVVILISGDRAARLAASVIAVMICCPIIIYLCNGTMYIDSKVLIPFIVLVLIVCGEFLMKLFHGAVNIRLIIIVFTAVTVLGILFSSRKNFYTLFIAADAVIAASTIIIYTKCGKRQAVIIPAAVISVISCIAVNLSDTYVTKEKLNMIYSEDIQKLVDKASASDTSFYRFANNTDSGMSVNRVYGDNFYSASIYSSSSNSEYRNFRFSGLLSENSIRNNAMQINPKNEIFNVLMGCRYRLSQSDKAMSGEVLEDCEEGYYLFRNNNALPVGYASANTMSEEFYNNLDYAERAEAILENIIVPENPQFTSIPDKTEKLDCNFTVVGDTSKITEINGAYEVDSDTQFAVSAFPEKPILDKIILLMFHADNRIAKRSERSDISVTVNGVKNKLSDPEWKYHNKNYQFSYVISSDAPIDELEFVFSKGNYLVSDFELYIMDKSVLENASRNKNEFIIERDKMGGDVIEGSIDVTDDGWFNISVPYDTGFEIYVDGVKTEYYKTNTAFIGFPITKGKHYITLNYQTPFWTVGMFMTIAGVGVGLCWTTGAGILRHRRRAVNRKSEAF